MSDINSYIERIEKRKLKEINDTLEKLQHQKRVNADWYNDTELPRFLKKYEELTQAIKELEEYKELTSVKDLSTSDYDQFLLYKEAMRNIKDTLETDQYENKTLLKYIDKVMHGKL